MEFITEGGRGVITDWYATLAVEAQVDFDDRLRYLANSSQHLWERPKYAPLRGYPKIGEIRCKANRIQYRPLGFFGPAEGQFTLLIGALEKDRKFIPKDAPEQAVRRKAIILADRSRIREYEF